MLERCAKWLLEEDGWLIVTHKNPDGDTVGSAAALCLGLRSLGKRAYVLASAEHTPRQRELLSGLCTDRTEGLLPLFADVAAPDMLCSEGAELTPALVIDHHKNNRCACERRCIMEQAAATGEMVYGLLLAMGAELTCEIARALYIAVATDTGCFRFANTGAQTHRIAAELLRFDIGMEEINRTYFEEKTPAALRLQGELIRGLRLYAQDRIALVAVSLEMRSRLCIREEDLEDVASLPRSVAGVQAGVTLRELSAGEWKVSLRTAASVDAATVCALFGGGGHARAAGCSIRGSADEVCDRLVCAITKYLQ